MDSNSKIYVAGNTGLVGSAIVRQLRELGYANILSSHRSHFYLRNQYDVEKFFNINQPEYVFLTAAKCGGVLDNTKYPVEYLLDNLNIQNNIISMSHMYGVKKLIFFASSSVYSKQCNFPLKESDLLIGDLEKTNEFYSLAKISGIKLCEAYRTQYNDNFISVNPCNIYGLENKIDSSKSHVMMSLIYKIWKAKKQNISFVECFGDGSPKREFLYADDIADASIFLMNQNTDSLINIGTGIECSILDIVNLISDIVKYDGDIIWDTSKPNGASRRVLDVTKLNSLGWKPKISLPDGIIKVVNYLNENYV
jgi:GDP-L-fucose synthase